LIAKVRPAMPEPSTRRSVWMRAMADRIMLPLRGLANQLF